MWRLLTNALSPCGRVSKILAVSKQVVSARTQSREGTNSPAVLSSSNYKYRFRQLSLPNALRELAEYCTRDETVPCLV